MLKATNWRIYRTNGYYLGEHSAFAPETAFCQFMSSRGRRICEDEIQFDALDNGTSGLITYLAEEYFLTPRDLRKVFSSPEWRDLMHQSDC
jgi:hypothetical protein